MIGIQELISRGRFIFHRAPKRYEVFKLLNGKNSTKDISKKTGRKLSSVLQDIEKLNDFELIRKKRNRDEIVKKDGASVFEKTPLIKHIPDSYFNEIVDIRRITKKKLAKNRSTSKKTTIHIPSSLEILDIVKNGEDQLYEFKSPGVKMEVISEEIAAFLHTRDGGIIFYGVDDEGTVIGSDLNRQEFDQRIHNSIVNTISPAPYIVLNDKIVMGVKIMLLIIPPWDKKNLFQYTKKNRYLIRKGANKFSLQPHEIKKLSRGEYVV